ncbi:MAG: DUF2817 domain-containing protein [Pirellulales bacterium]
MIRLFTPEYATARQRFLAVGAATGGQAEAVEFAARGPAGEPLFLDCLRLGDQGARRVLLLSSGLHGVEGFFGSAVQCRLLESGALAPPAGAAVVLLHALNPFGFAWLRRTNEQNIDCNRNFLLASQQYSGAAPEYAALDALLNPRCAPRPDTFLLRAAWKILRLGMPAFKQAVAAGQYEFPRGLFFGGHGPSETLRVLDERLPSWLGPAERVLHLDYHTGLGPWGDYQLYLEQDLPDEARARLEQLGPGKLRATRRGDLPYVTKGSIQPWLAQRLAGRDYVGLCAEFGTYAPLRVLAALRAENQAFHYAERGQPTATRARQRLLEVFCPADAGWRETVVERGCALAHRALEQVREAG